MEKMIPIFASDKNHCPLVAKQNAHNKWELWHLSDEKEAKYDFRVFKEHEYDAVEVTNSTTGRALIKVLKDGEWREIVFIQPTRLQENKAKTLLSHYQMVNRAWSGCQCKR